MIRWLALLLLFPTIAVAQTGAPTESTSGTAQSGAPAVLTDGVSPPENLGPHICAGYPDAAVIALAQGSTIVDFTVTPQGTVSDVTVEKSSGVGELDSATMLCAKGWLFKPATRNGAPIAYRTKLQLEWKVALDSEMPSNSLPANSGVISAPVWSHGGRACEQWHAGSDRPPHTVILSFFVEPDGAVKGITILQSSGRDDVDKDALGCLAEREYVPAKRDGAPVEVHITDWLY